MLLPHVVSPIVIVFLLGCVEHAYVLESGQEPIAQPYQTERGVVAAAASFTVGGDISPIDDPLEQTGEGGQAPRNDGLDQINNRAGVERGPGSAPAD
jgi:hypothetical protein